MTKRPLAYAALALLLWPMLAATQTPVGAEFRLNSYTTGLQQFPSVATNPLGGFVVAWRSPHDGSGFGVFARRFDLAGTPQGAEFQVNETTAYDQSDPSIAADAAGNFVVAWSSLLQDGSFNGIFAGRFDSGGAPLAAEFRVNTTTAGSQNQSAVAMAPSGRFVVAWQGDDGSHSGVFAQPFTDTATPVGPELLVNTYTTGQEDNPSVAMDAAGDFVVAWRASSLAPFHHSGIYAQRFAAAGQPRGGEVRVNTSLPALDHGYGYTAAAADPAGDFIVVWQRSIMDPPSPPPLPSFLFLQARRFDVAGAPLGSEFQAPPDRAFSYAAGLDGGGHALLVWHESDVDGRRGVFGQWLDPSGVPLGDEFRIDVQQTDASRVALGVQPSGRLLAVWESHVPGPAPDSDIVGRVLEPLAPTGLVVDGEATAGSNGNGVFEPGESVAVEPSWRNLSGLDQTFGGAASSFTGPGAPGDPVYTIQDAAASYGTVEIGRAHV